MKCQLEHWGFQIHEFGRDNAATRDAVLAQLAGSDPRPRARERLERLHAGLREHGERVAGLLADAGLEPARHAAGPGAVERNPAETRLDAYLHQIHRDWGWGSEHHEIAEALDALVSILGGRPLGKMLVLGAGACRIPYALHRAGGAEMTVALDIDPLAFVVARRVLSGDSVALFEFPAAPREPKVVAVDRKLSAPPEFLDGADRFHLVFADALDPPVGDGTFDTVFTPWFIDQVPRDLANLLPVIRRVLADGGTWINQGPLLYHPKHTMAAHRYTVEEVLELAAEAGFSVESHRYERMTYLESPAGTQGRTETVLTFRASKVAAVSKSEDGSGPERDDGLAQPDTPVPRWSGLEAYRPPHPMFAAIIALIDGQRTARDIARVMIEKHGLPEKAALGGVQTCLAEIYRGAQEAR